MHCSCCVVLSCVGVERDMHVAVFAMSAYFGKGRGGFPKAQSCSGVPST